MTNVPWLWPDSIVTRVIDGDSFTARVTRDLGFHGTATFDIKLRLNRINAPPVKTTEGTLASNAAALLMLTTSPVLIETVKPYKYGDEWMAEVTLSSGVNVSDEMVRTEHAVYWDGTGPRPGG
jgi:endonuclease YncB( thermonuclease family)